MLKAGVFSVTLRAVEAHELALVFSFLSLAARMAE